MLRHTPVLSQYLLFSAVSPCTWQDYDASPTTGAKHNGTDMGLFDKIRSARESVTRSRERRGTSLREDFGIWSDTLAGRPPKDETAPKPRQGRCENHAPQERGSLSNMLVDMLVVPAVFALWWKQIVLEPDYILPGAETAAELKHPREYGLDNFMVRPIAYGKRDPNTGLPEIDKTTGEHTVGRQLLAWYAPPKPGFPTLAYCHGNAGSIDARRIVLKEMNDAGFGVMIVAYPGYKGSKFDMAGHKQEMNERTFVKAAKSMYNALRTELGPDANIIMFGESLGSAVAMKAAREIELGDRYHNVPKQKVAAVTCFAAFSSLPERVQEEYPFMPASSLMGIQLDAESVVAKIKAPVILLHGTADEVTCKHHSLRLKKAGGDNVEVILIPGANHRLSKQLYPHAHRYSPVSQTTKDPELLKIDRDQVRMLLAHVQSSLHKNGLCPPPAAIPVIEDGASSTDGVKWRGALSQSTSHQRNGHAGDNGHHDCDTHKANKPARGA